MIGNRFAALRWHIVPATHGSSQQGGWNVRHESDMSMCPRSDVDLALRIDGSCPLRRVRKVVGISPRQGPSFVISFSVLTNVDENC